MFQSFISILDIQSWWEVPSIAHFCSLFRDAFNLLDFDIEELEEALLNDGTEESRSQLLQELIVRLLCGCLGNNDISTFNYQMFLRRLFRQKCQEHNRYNPFNTDIDFQFLPLRTKVEILHALCDFRLDADDVFDLLKNLESESLRVEPLGYDNNESAYWYFYGTRLYREDFEKLPASTNKKHKNKKSSTNDFCNEELKKSSVWQVVCFTEQDWKNLTLKFKDSLHKCEKALYRSLNENFLPEIPRLFQEKERLQRKRLLEMQPRRQSIRVQELELHRKTEIEQDDKDFNEVTEIDLIENQIEKEKFKNSDRRKLRNRNEKDRIKEKELKIDEENNKNFGTNIVGRQTNNSLASAIGQIVIKPMPPPPVSTTTTKKKMKTSQVFRQTDEDLQTGMYKILEAVKNHDDAWPFIDPVEEEYAPNYYTVIRRPMDLQRMEDKLDSGEYLTFEKFQSDFQLIVDNCRLYNGSKNEYTKMVDNLLDVFEKATKRYLDEITSSDEEIAVEFQNEKSTDDTSETKHTKKKKERKHKKKKFLKSEYKTKKAFKRKEIDTDKIINLLDGKKNKLENKKEKTSKISKIKNKLKKKKRKTNINDDDDFKNNEKSEVQNSSLKSKKKKNNHKKNEIVDINMLEKPINETFGEENGKEKKDKIKKRKETIKENIKTNETAMSKDEIRKDFKQKQHISAGKETKNTNNVLGKKENFSNLRNSSPIKKKDSFIIDKNDSFIVDENNLKIVNNNDLTTADNKMTKQLGGGVKRKYNKTTKNTIYNKNTKGDLKNKTTYNFSENESDGDDDETLSKSLNNVSTKKLKKKEPQCDIPPPAFQEALDLVTEQSLKDMSMWLESSPKQSDFDENSRSNASSPVLNTDELELVTSKLEADYMRIAADKHSAESQQNLDSNHSTMLSLPTTQQPVLNHSRGKETINVLSSNQTNSTSHKKRAYNKDNKTITKRREIQRTIDRLQPGKSKGNLIANINKTEENNLFSLGSLAKLKEAKIQLKAKIETENKPTLSLGTVLDSFGQKHNFTDSEKENEIAKEKKNNEELNQIEKITQGNTGEIKTADDKKETDDENKSSNDQVKKTPQSVTPNLSAWFKAFGAPKTANSPSAVKKKMEEKDTGEQTSIDEKVTTKSDQIDENSQKSPTLINSPIGGSEIPPSQHIPRTRKASTGSTVSERSSFSQDNTDPLDSPRISLDERLGIYPAPYPSPLQQRSPCSASPLMASPRDDMRVQLPYPQINGAIRVGFYQDTVKSSPEKSCSPREQPQSPYTPYSQHVYIPPTQVTYQYNTSSYPSPQSAQHSPQNIASYKEKDNYDKALDCKTQYNDEPPLPAKGSESNEIQKLNETKEELTDRFGQSSNQVFPMKKRYYDSNMSEKNDGEKEISAIRNDEPNDDDCPLNYQNLSTTDYSKTYDYKNTSNSFNQDVVNQRLCYDKEQNSQRLSYENLEKESNLNYDKEQRLNYDTQTKDHQRLSYNNKDCQSGFHKDEPQNMIKTIDLTESDNSYDRPLSLQNRSYDSRTNEQLNYSRMDYKETDRHRNDNIQHHLTDLRIPNIRGNEFRSSSAINSQDYQNMPINMNIPNRTNYTSSTLNLGLARNNLDRYQDNLMALPTGSYYDKMYPKTTGINEQMPQIFSQNDNSLYHLNSLATTSQSSVNSENYSKTSSTPQFAVSQEKKRGRRKKTDLLKEPTITSNNSAAFQTYSTLKMSKPNEQTNYSSLKITPEVPAISLKTSSVNNPFNFSTPSGLGLTTPGLYNNSDSGGYFEDYRNSPYNYMAASMAVHQASSVNAEDNSQASNNEKSIQNRQSVNTNATSVTTTAAAAVAAAAQFTSFLSQTSRNNLTNNSPYVQAFNSPFNLNPHQSLMDASSPLYQQYLRQEELLRHSVTGALHSGLLGAPTHPNYPSGYPLGMRQPFDRSWL